MAYVRVQRIRQLTVRTSAPLRRMTAARRKMFDKFPLGAEVSFYGEPVGTVIDHDHDRGRVVTTQGTYMPTELVVTKLPDKTKKE